MLKTLGFIVVISLAIVITGCDSVHQTWHNVESPIHKWFDETLGIHDDEHTAKDEPIDMGIWAEDKEIVETEGTFPKIEEK